MSLTSTDIVNRALQLIGNNQQPVTGSAPNFDNSTSGQAAKVLYAGVVQTVGRQFGWDFSRNTVLLVATGNAPPVPWAYEYLYPTNGVQVRQVMPTAQTDPNDPRPTNWTVANNTVNGAPKKVIQTSLATALAVFTNQPPEDLWDAEFTEAVVRMLASEFAMATAGKPDTSRDALEQSQKFAQLGSTRDS